MAESKENLHLFFATANKNILSQRGMPRHLHSSHIHQGKLHFRSCAKASFRQFSAQLSFRQRKKSTFKSTLTWSPRALTSISFSTSSAADANLWFSYMQMVNFSHRRQQRQTLQICLWQPPYCDTATFSLTCTLPQLAGNYHESYRTIQLHCGKLTHVPRCSGPTRTW